MTEQRAGSPFVRLEFRDKIALAVIDNPPVNASTAAMRRGIVVALSEATDRKARGLVLIGAGRNFISGSDLREFDGALAEPELPAVIEAIEKAPFPVVAAISGAALGGGYEVALACDARIGDSTALVGLPEVKLGILPGAGGTQRLPRLVGVARAIELIASGRRVTAAEAHELGMIDLLVRSDLLAAAMAAIGEIAPGKRLLLQRDAPPVSDAAILAAERSALSKAGSHGAAATAIEIIKNAATLDAQEALRRERDAFNRLRQSAEAKALRYGFFAERATRQAFDAFPAKPRTIEKIGLVGGGSMGAGIAMTFLAAGYPVTLVERDEEAVDAARQRVRGLLDAAVSRKRISAAVAEDCLRRIGFSAGLDALAEADVLIEAIVEDMAAKKRLFADMAAIAKPGAILASNTSYLDIGELAGVMDRPADVIGLHFFNPASIMRLVEVVRTQKSGADALAGAFRLVRRLGKIPVLANLGEGFIGNRIYASYRQQCEFLVEDGATPEEVDAAMEEFGFAMGPFKVGDLSGLDIAWARRNRLASKRDPRERHVELPDRLCKAGRFGRKTGAGWYAYPDGPEPRSDPATGRLIEAYRREKGIVQQSFSPDDIRARALGALVNEARRVLAENIAFAPGDIDVVMVNGFGFPAWRGGPLYWAMQQDRTTIETMIEIAAAVKGSGFERAHSSENAAPDRRA